MPLRTPPSDVSLGPLSITSSQAPQGFLRTSGSSDAYRRAIYLRSTTGSDGNPGTSWALAKATFVAACTASQAGDFIYISQSHVEAPTGGVNAAIIPSIAASISILSVQDTAQPPVTANTSPTSLVGSSGGSTSIILTSGSTGNCYLSGMLFSGSITSGSYSFFTSVSGYAKMENCRVNSDGSSGSIFFISGTTGMQVEVVNCIFRFGATVQGFSPANTTFRNCSIASGGTNIALIIPANANPIGTILFESCDFSTMASTLNLVGVVGTAGAPNVITFRNCKLPASWTGSLFTGTFNSPKDRVQLFNCDSSGTNYRLWIEEVYGSVKQETLIVRTGGASDGTTPLSWIMTTNTAILPVQDRAFSGEATPTYPHRVLTSPEIVVWNSAVGSSKTVSVEIVYDTASGLYPILTNEDVWIDLQYLSQSGAPLGTLISSRASNVLGAGTTLPASSVAWTTTGLATPDKRTLSVTFTPQLVGFIHVTVYSRRFSTPYSGSAAILYVDPLLTVA